VAAEDGLANQFGGTENEAVSQLDTLLNDAVPMRMNPMCRWARFYPWH